ncbi:MAG TPA: cyanophycinase [Gemmatimonadaceae bacterium]|nr:cyanophycinase [Gemmatimonadaceae bacterium]
MKRGSNLRPFTGTRAGAHGGSVPKAVACALGIVATAWGSTALGQGTGKEFSASSVPVSRAARGTLLIVGGGSQPDELVKHFVDLAGGRGKARIAILPMATSSAAESGAEKKAQLDSLGAQSFVLNFPRANADDDSLVRKIQTATGIWFPGGDQSLLTAAIGGSAVLRAIHERYSAGAVVGGTSAGAAVMSDSMITGNQYYPGVATALDSSNFTRIGRHTIEIVPGLGFVHNAIVDQHFIRRQRENRLISVVLERPSLLGVGIDEGTALEVTPDGKWLVLGRSAVMIFDARRARTTSAQVPVLGATDVRLSLLPAGSTYDPRTGEALLPGMRP